MSKEPRWRDAAGRARAAVRILTEPGESRPGIVACRPKAPRGVTARKYGDLCMKVAGSISTAVQRSLRRLARFGGRPVAEEFVTRTLRFTAKLSACQHRRLDDVFGSQQRLYNAALEAWRSNYQIWQRRHALGGRGSETKPRSPTFYDLCSELTKLRADDQEYGSVAVEVSRGTLRRLTRAIDGFYAGQRGYPRFRSFRRWRSVEVPNAHNTMIELPPAGGRWARLQVKGLPRMRFDPSRHPGIDLATADVRTVRVVRTPLRVEVHVVVSEKAPEPAGRPVNPVGIDAGIRRRFTMSDGTSTDRRRHSRSRIKRCQRAVSRAAPGSRSRHKKRCALAREHTRQAEARRDDDHRWAANLVSRYDGFAVEDLQVANMVKNRRLADAVMQQGWDQAYRTLEHTAARAGLPLVYVPAPYTSQTCSECGHRLADKLTLARRVFACPDCGQVSDRDENAADNILRLGFGPGPGGTLPGVCRTTNFSAKTRQPRGCRAGEHTEQYVKTSGQPARNLHI